MKKANKKVIVNGVVPRSHSACFSLAKKILNKHKVGTEIKPNTFSFDFLVWLFNQHPNAQSKIPSKITRIAIKSYQVAGYNKITKCFYYLCECGYKDTISFRACVDSAFGAWYQNFRRLSNALRNTLEVYRFQRWRKLVDEKRPNCALTGVPLTAKTAAFDHYDGTFAELVVRFTRHTKGTKTALTLLTIIDGLEQLHPKYLDWFIKLHDTHTKVRVIHKDENDRLNHEAQKNKKSGKK